MRQKKLKDLKVGICQINSTVGDIFNNSQKIVNYINKCKEEKCDIALFPELVITGYPPEDLLLRKDFIEKNITALNGIAKYCEGITAIIGFANKVKDKLFNSAAVIQDKKIIHIHNKVCLPNYGVFDEKRYFSEGESFKTLKLKNNFFVVAICEDLWDKNGIKKMIKSGKIDCIFVLNASPFHFEKFKEREKVASYTSKLKKTYIFYANLVGGQDELVFDGASFATDNQGKIIAQAKQFEETLLVVDINGKNLIASYKNKYAEIYNALCLGLKDYVLKNKFSKVVLGLSGGIDSALVATIAVDALGKDNVKAVFMPSKYTSEVSYVGAKELAQNLGIEMFEISIDKIFDEFTLALSDLFKNTKPDITEENLQSRIRGTILMALSNKFGYLVLATGNKSEYSTGYATLYGDMVGGIAPIKDVPKTMVYELVKYRNSISPVIPKVIIERAPTAELKYNQTDQDTLPPYELLDKIINLYIEKDKGLLEMTKSGITKTILDKVIKMIDKSEYKRKQSPPGIKITPKAFGKDRRMPITNRYTS